MQLEGSLDQFHLRELIEMIVYSSVTGVLEVRLGDEVGQLFFHDGLPYHAEAGERAGFDAVCAMFQEHDAPFRFVAGVACEAKTLWLDPWDLIERAEHEAEVWLRLRPRIPSLSWVPALCSTAGTEQVHIGEGVWPVLSAVDGQRNVAAIAQELGLAPIDVCVALVSLLDQGLITIKPPRPAPLQPRPVAPPAATGFFERLIAGIPIQEHTPPSHPPADHADGNGAPPTYRT